MKSAFIHKTICLLALISFCFAMPSVEGQTLPFGKKASQTFAVIIGVSEYQNEAIPDLQFAHRDAEAFFDYLRSTAGGEVPEQNIILLKNEEATTARMASSLDWLIEAVSEGDNAIIYFSGHGDVETKTANQHGFLLTFDSPSSAYIAGAYPLFYLQSVVTTISTLKNATVTMYMDACHAGKLAGSTVNGPQVTSSVIAKQYANEVKIMSCQSDEYSLEGKQWGGGRGVFSFHLIEGLVGLADKDGDLKVKLIELERYLEDKVSLEVQPNSQIPMAIGRKSQVISYVDELEMIKRQLDESDDTPMLAIAESKGLEENVLANLDSTILDKYRQFYRLLNTDFLIKTTETPEETLTANDLYEELIKVRELESLHSTMKRNLVVALQDEGQAGINEYLEIKGHQIDASTYDINRQIQENNRLSLYFERAAQLLGDNHYMYNDALSKKLYFEACAMYFIATQHNSKDAVLQAAIDLLEKANTLVPNSPHVLIELSSAYSLVGMSDRAIELAEKATQIAPKWPIPYDFLANYFYSIADYDQAIFYAEKALEIQPNFEHAFATLTHCHYDIGNYNFIIDLCRKTIDRTPTYLAAYIELGIALMTIEEFDKAVEILLEAKKLAPNNPMVYANLSEVYHFKNNQQKSELYALRAIAIDSNLVHPYLILASIYKNENIDRAIETLYTVLHNYPDDYILLGQIGQLYLIKHKYKKAAELFIRALEINSTDVFNLFNMFCLYYQKEDEKVAFDWLDKAFKNGLINFIESHEIESTDCFSEAKKSEMYKELIIKYSNN